MAFQPYIDDPPAGATDSPRPKVYVESYFEFSTVGPGSGAHDMCLLAGGENIAAVMDIPYPKITSEWVVTQNPDVIIKAASYGNGYEAADNKEFNALCRTIMGRPVCLHHGCRNRPRARDGQCHLGRPRYLIGVAWLARWFYPERFADVDPDKWHAEYLQRFQGIAYKGVYASDPIPGEKP